MDFEESPTPQRKGSGTETQTEVLPGTKARAGLPRTPASAVSLGSPSPVFVALWVQTAFQPFQGL